MAESLVLLKVQADPPSAVQFRARCICSRGRRHTLQTLQRPLELSSDSLIILMGLLEGDSESPGVPCSRRCCGSPVSRERCRPCRRCGAFRWPSSAPARRPPLWWPIPSHTPSPWYLVSGYRKSQNYSTEAAGSSVPVHYHSFLPLCSRASSFLSAAGGDVFTPSLERSLENNPGNLKGDGHFHTPSG